MKKIILLPLMVFGAASTAQLNTKFPGTNSGAESKWTFGGTAGLGGAFGNGSGTSLYLSPRIGYKVTENLEGGAAANFSWSNSKYFSSTILGAGPYANYYFGRSFYISGMFQEYFINYRNKYDNLKYDTNEAALYFGGGYIQRLGSHTHLQIGGMYNVLYQKDKSIFSSGFLPSVGVVFGL